MKTKSPSVERIGLVTGLITSLALICYFMLMKALGLEQVIELRFFNCIITTIGICYGIQKLKRELHSEEFYLQGWAEGMYITVVATITFALFMTVYVMNFDSALLEIIENRMHIQSMAGLTVFGAILMEGIASGVVITLAAMQYFKSPDEKKQEKAKKFKRMHFN